MVSLVTMVTFITAVGYRGYLPIASHADTCDVTGAIR
jgi:hypothetical protein